MHLAWIFLLFFYGVASHMGGFFDLQGLDNLVAWIMADRIQLEDEVKERCKLCDLTKQGLEK